MALTIALVAVVLCSANDVSGSATDANGRQWGLSNSGRKGTKRGGFFISTPSSFLSAWLSTAVVPTSDKKARRALHQKLTVDGDEDAEEGDDDVDEDEDEEEESSEAEQADEVSSSTTTSTSTSTSTRRDNVGHDQSHKIKLAPKKTATVDDDGDDDDADADAKNKSAVENDNDTPAPPSFQLALLKQFAPTIVYMVASRFIMKLDFANARVVQVRRKVVAVP